MFYGILYLSRPSSLNEGSSEPMPYLALIFGACLFAHDHAFRGSEDDNLEPSPGRPSRCEAIPWGPWIVFRFIFLSR